MLAFDGRPLGLSRLCCDGQVLQVFKEVRLAGYDYDVEAFAWADVSRSLRPQGLQLGSPIRSRLGGRGRTAAAPSVGGRWMTKPSEAVFGAVTHAGRSATAHENGAAAAAAGTRSALHEARAAIAGPVAADRAVDQGQRAAHAGDAAAAPAGPVHPSSPRDCPAGASAAATSALAACSAPGTGSASSTAGG